MYAAEQLFGVKEVSKSNQQVIFCQRGHHQIGHNTNSYPCNLELQLQASGDPLGLS